MSLTEHTRPLIKRLRGYGFELPDVPEAGLDHASESHMPSADDLDNIAGEPIENSELAGELPFNTSWLLSLAKSMLSGVSAIFSNTVVIFITVTFMLLEAARSSRHFPSSVPSPHRPGYRIPSFWIL